MDPSALLLQHFDPFTPATERFPSFAEWVSQHEYRGPMVNHGRTKTSYSRRTPPEVIKPSLAEAVAELKGFFAEVPPAEFTKCRNATNPFEQLSFAPFMNRAALKLANIDAVFGLSYQLPTLDVPTTPEEVEARFATHAFRSKQTYSPLINDPPVVKTRFTKLWHFVDLAGAPGGMSEYLLWRHPNSRGFGISLKSGIKWNLHSDRFTINYGSDRDGDLYKVTNVRSFSEFVRRKVGTGVDLAVADGGFDVTGQEGEQEALSGRLLLGQAVTALLSLKEGGHFVMKLFDVQTLFTIQLLQLLADAFQGLTLFKPISSRPANSERYVVCRSLRGGKLLTKLTEQLALALEVAAENPITSLFDPTQLDPEFIAYLKTNNEELANAQADSLERILVCVDPQVEGAELVKPLGAYHLDRAKALWYLP